MELFFIWMVDNPISISIISEGIGIVNTKVVDTTGIEPATDNLSGFPRNHPTCPHVGRITWAH